MKTAELANRIFDRSVERYHISDDINLPCPNPFEKGSIEAIFFEKNWVDAVQWHLEDIIRDPEIDPVDALALKRRIDKSNQVRTDMVEEIDSWFRDKFRNVVPAPDRFHQHRIAGMGSRPSLNTCPEDMAHEGTGSTH